MMQYKMLFWGRFRCYEDGENIAQALNQELQIYSEEGWVVRECSFDEGGYPAFALLEWDGISIKPDQFSQEATDETTTA